MAGTRSVTLTLSGHVELAAALAQFDKSVQRGIQRKILAAVGQKNISEIRKRTPRSRITETSEGWSAATRQRRAGNRDALRRSLNKNVSAKWDSSAEMAAKGVLGVTVRHLYPGARGSKGKPIGPHAHLIEHGHVGVFWGQRASVGWVPAYPYFWEGVAAARPQIKSLVKTRGKKIIEDTRKRLAAKLLKKGAKG